MAHDKRAWNAPYQGGVSNFDQDRNRGAGMPSTLTDAGYDRMAVVLEAKQQRRAAFSAAWNSDAPGGGQVPQAVAPVPQTRTACHAGLEQRRYASVKDVQADGFTRIATGMYRKGHSVWELRKDDGGYALVRKREERLVDLREAAGPGTQAAVDAGIIRTASGGPAPVVGCPVCSSQVVWHCPTGRGLAVCSRSAAAGGSARVAGPMCSFDSGVAARRADGHVDLYAYGQRVGQLTEEAPMPMDEGPEDLDGGGAADDFDVPFPEGGDSAVAGGELADQAEALYDAHELMHDREPTLTPGAPLVEAVEEIMADESMDDGGDVEFDPIEDMDLLDDGADDDEDPLDLEIEAGAHKCGKCGQTKCGCGRMAARVAWLMRHAQLDPALVSKYEDEWQQPQGLEAVLEEVNFLLESRGRVPELEQIKKSLESQIAEASQGKVGRRTASKSAAATPRLAGKLVGQKILAVRKGGVAEGIVLEMMPLGDLMADFGEGPEEMALDNLLAPELDGLDLEEAEACGCDAPLIDAEPLDLDELETAEDNAEDGDAEDDGEGDDDVDVLDGTGTEPQVLVITIDDVAGA